MMTIDQKSCFIRSMRNKYNKRDWEIYARNMLKGELIRQGVDYQELSVRLTGMGIPNVSVENLRNKINRGTFSAAFLIQVLFAVGSKRINMDNLPIPPHARLNPPK